MRKKTESHTVCQSVDKALFSEACMQMIGALQGQNGIGTLREKTIHSVLKYYYAPNPAYHEITVLDLSRRKEAAAGCSRTAPV